MQPVHKISTKNLLFPPRILKPPVRIYYRVEAHHLGPSYVLYRAMTYLRTSTNAIIINVNDMSSNDSHDYPCCPRRKNYAE